MTYFLNLDSDKLCLYSGLQNSDMLQKSTCIWSLSINELVLIAEYTTDCGPYDDDYFLVFVAFRQGKLDRVECPFSAEGLQDAFGALSALLNADLQLQLCASVKWNSTVLWPAELKGVSYYDFRKSEPMTAWQSLKLSFFPRMEMALSDNVKNYLHDLVGTAGATFE